MADENRNRNDNDRNRNNEPIEPSRGSGEESRSGKIGSHPGGYGPSQGTSNVEREPSSGVEREH